MLKIKQSESGYWFNSEWFYLDEIETTIYKKSLLKILKRIFVLMNMKKENGKAIIPFVNQTARDIG